MLGSARLLVAALLVLPLAACGGKFEAPPDGVGGDAGATDTGGSATDAGGTDTAPELCSADKCGPMPRGPAQMCSDGSIGGFTGRCIQMAGGTCGWEYRDCPPEKTCVQATDCQPYQYCVKGVGACGGVGKCAARPDGCDTLYSPVCGCDGKTYGNSCGAAGAGMAVAYTGECKPTTSYCDAKVPCANGQFCKYPDGYCFGSAPAPSPPEPAGGTCTQKPMGCPDIWSPVCGCDGKTYGNTCEASSVGMNVARQGACDAPPPPVKTCGGFVGQACASTEWCDFPDGSYCGGGDEMGYCKTRPTACTKEIDPVCGCDGKTYTNPCTAYKAGVDYQKKGGC